MTTSTKDFDPNDRAAIWDAIQFGGPDHPIAIAFGVRLTELGKLLVDQAERTGAYPTRIALPKPTNAFEEIANTYIANRLL